MKFDKNFEEEILAQALRDLNYLKKASRILDSHHFVSIQHGWIWKTIKNIWSIHKELATPALILLKAKSDFPEDEERTDYIELVSRLYKKKITSSSASLDELNNFVRMVNAQISLEQAIKNLEKGKIDNIYKELNKLIKQDIKPRNYTSIKWIEDFNARQVEREYKKNHPEEFTTIPTGFSKLDAIIGGIQHGELGLILATTGKGKSIMLSNIAYHAIKHNFKVVYFGLEMPARQIAMRQDSRWLGIPYSKFKSFDFSKTELELINNRLEKVHDKWKGLFQIISMPLRKCNINTIQSTLEDLAEEDGFIPELICFDSGDHLKGTNKFESIRLEQASVYWDLKNLAEEGGFAVWSTTHAGREWAEKVATAEASSESYDKSRIADIVISLNTPKRSSRSTKSVVDEEGEETEEEDTTSRTVAKGEYLELFLAKYRDGYSKITIPMDAIFERMFIEEIL